MQAKDDLASPFVHIVDPQTVDLYIVRGKGKPRQIFKPFFGRTENGHSSRSSRCF